MVLAVMTDTEYQLDGVTILEERNPETVQLHVFCHRVYLISHRNRQHPKAERWQWRDQTLQSAGRNPHSVPGSSPTFHDLVESDTARPDTRTHRQPVLF